MRRSRASASSASPSVERERRRALARLRLALRGRPARPPPPRARRRRRPTAARRRQARRRRGRCGCGRTRGQPSQRATCSSTACAASSGVAHLRDLGGDPPRRLAVGRVLEHPVDGGAQRLRGQLARPEHERGTGRLGPGRVVELVGRLRHEHEREARTERRERRPRAAVRARPPRARQHVRLRHEPLDANTRRRRPELGWIDVASDRHERGERAVERIEDRPQHRGVVEDGAERRVDERLAELGEPRRAASAAPGHRPQADDAVRAAAPRRSSRARGRRRGRGTRRRRDRARARARARAAPTTSAAGSSTALRDHRSERVVDHRKPEHRGRDRRGKVAAVVQDRVGRQRARLEEGRQLCRRMVLRPKSVENRDRAPLLLGELSQPPPSRPAGAPPRRPGRRRTRRSPPPRLAGPARARRPRTTTSCPRATSARPSGSNGLKCPSLGTQLKTTRTG